MFQRSRVQFPGHPVSDHARIKKQNGKRKKKRENYKCLGLEPSDWCSSGACIQHIGGLLLTDKNKTWKPARQFRVRSWRYLWFCSGQRLNMSEAFRGPVIFFCPFTAAWEPVQTPGIYGIRTPSGDQLEPFRPPPAKVGSGYQSFKAAYPTACVPGNTRNIHISLGFSWGIN